MTFDEFIAKLDRDNKSTKEVANWILYFHEKYPVAFEWKRADLTEIVMNQLDRKIYPLVDKRLAFPHLM